jgi:hypothetical protein
VLSLVSPDLPPGALISDLPMGLSTGKGGPSLHLIASASAYRDHQGLMALTVSISVPRDQVFNYHMYGRRKLVVFGAAEEVEGGMPGPVLFEQDVRTWILYVL